MLNLSAVAKALSPYGSSSPMLWVSPRDQTDVRMYINIGKAGTVYCPLSKANTKPLPKSYVYAASRDEWHVGLRNLVATHDITVDIAVALAACWDAPTVAAAKPATPAPVAAPAAQARLNTYANPYAAPGGCMYFDEI